MNYNIKQSFKASDLQVGDLMYDALNDVMVRVAYIGSIVNQKVHELKVSKNLDSISSKTTNIEIKQFVLEDTEDKVIFIIDVIGREGKLPSLENGKPRFRHLMKAYEPTPTINWPLCPQPQPIPCPNYPTYPNYPDYPWYWNWSTTNISDNLNLGVNTLNGNVSTNLDISSHDANMNSISMNNLDGVTFTFTNKNQESEK